MTHKIYLQALVLCIFGAAPFMAGNLAVANDLGDAKSRLQRVQQEILSIQKKQARDKGEAGQFQLRLNKIESQIGKVTHQRHDNLKLLERERSNLNKLEANKMGLLSDLAGQRSALSSQVRAAYQLGQQERLKMLFNQQNPATVGRMLAYYKYFNDSRVSEIDITRQTLTSLRTTEREITEQTAALEDISLRLQQQLAALESTRAQRHDLLSSIEQEINKSGIQIESLHKDQGTLETLVSTLENTIKTLPQNTPVDTPFTKLKGHIAWPVAGKINNRFGKPRDSSRPDLKWRGITIDSTPGEEVRAISQGTVVFSDWMNGYGLLLIVDHGDSFMSLYGQNESLFKQLGEQVLAGEQIAQVGSSGGLHKDGLYFEIRHKGKPLDPASWCTSETRQAQR